MSIKKSWERQHSFLNLTNYSLLKTGLENVGLHIIERTRLSFVNAGSAVI